MHAMNGIYQFFVKGGIMMYPLLLSSILAVAIILERTFRLRRKKVINPQLVQMIEAIRDSRDLDVARTICGQTNSAFTNILKVGFNNHHLNHNEIKELLEDQGRQEVRSLEWGLGALETIAASAPLMGLLGTVLGMVRVFNVIAQIGIGQASALSGGISEALNTTVFGLFIGIPALIAYNYFVHKADDLVLDIEKHSATLIQKIQQIKS